MLKLPDRASRGMAALLMLLCASIAVPNVARTQEVELRVSSASDANSMDPQSHNNIPNVQLHKQIYEGLVGRGPDLELAPALATKWEQVEPTRWRFTLRPDVVFHEGQSFSSADVVFSLARVAKEGSAFRNFVDLVKEVVPVDALTVDIVTGEPDPILPNKLVNVAIMSEVWSKEHNAEAPFNAAKNEEIYTVRNANGTGPFRLVGRDPNVRTELARFDRWWGKTDGNVTKYVSVPISSAPTRLAALLSQQVDVLLDPPLQDLARLKASPDIKVLTGPEIRSMFIVMDQKSPELKYSDVKGKNPFQDLRVRQALYQAIDINAIVQRIMLGLATPAGIPFGPGVAGYPADADTRLPYDPERAKALLTEAGYPDGFGVTLNCPNNRYFNDEAVCTALVSMWAKIGMKVTLNAEPLSQFSPRLARNDTSMFFLGSGSSTLDGFFPIQQNLMAPTDRPGDGAFNKGGYNNPKLNELAAEIRSELDVAKRNDLIRQAMEVYKEDVAGLPLYHSQIAWAVRGNVEASLRADALLEAKWVKITK